MKLIIFGPPGAGKGTYSSRIATNLDIVKISTGDIFREEIDRKTAMGRTMERYVTTGALIPDDLVIAILKTRIDAVAERGFILDGYPRTLSQAQALDVITPIDAIVNLIAPSELLVEKISSRRICRRCGEIYNIADINTTINGVTFRLPPLAPQRDGICDKCGGDLYQRADDRPDVVLDRLEVYTQQSRPVLSHYRGRVPFIDIEASETAAVMADEITRRLKALLVEGG
jgi:adenylate kinase